MLLNGANAACIKPAQFGTKVEVVRLAVVTIATRTIEMKRLVLPFAVAALFVVGLALVETSGYVLQAQTAAAQDAKATRSTRLMSSPGEQAQVVTTVRSGATLSILETKGRWYRVRVNGRTGWITRSNVAVPQQARTPVRTTRRRAFVEGRSTNRKRPRSAPSDRVGADAISDDVDDGFDDDNDDGFGDEDDDDEKTAPAPDTVVAVSDTRIRKSPSNRAKSVARARSGDTLFVIERDDKWLKVENQDGEEGWIAAKYVDAGDYNYKKVGYRYYGGLGYSTISQAFSTPNDCDLCNYSLSSGAMAVSIGGDVIYDYDKDYLIAGDLNYTYTRANPGIRFVDADQNPADISFQMHRIDVGARAGYKLGKETGMAAYGRVGYHYNRFGIDDVENFTVNLPRIPSEILSGFTVGVLLDVPQFNPKFAFRLGADMLINGTRVQTRGLEDGLLSDSSAIWGHARVDYKWKPDMKITGQYYYSGLSTKWTGTNGDSLRDHAAAEAKRDDVVHAMFLGLSKAL